MDKFNFEIFDGTSFADLCKEVVSRSSSKKDQLDTLISDIRPLIKNSNDAMMFLPRIKELLDVGVKNDEQLVKLMAVLQRTATSSDGEGNNEYSLSEEDKEQLLSLAKQADTEVADIKKQIDTDISNHSKISGSTNNTTSTSL